MFETTATSKGQIVIPSEVRKRFGIKRGTRIRMEINERSHQIVLQPITREYIQSMRGRLRGKGVMRALMQEKKRERER
ncbi:MAG: AbrB/MazE/SpoVT family DNA-binding domain-containing protein [Ignavibacteriae bacterium]|nr:AbrB/MazE/SpoVT family DNA-binding domain-containing protein [Ignavibacteriota bacterium]